MYRDGRLDPERRARLEALPGWAWDPYKADWDDGFAHLRRFMERKGNARVPHGYREDGFRLGTANGSTFSDSCTVERDREGLTRSVAPGWKRCLAGPGTRASLAGRRASPTCNDSSSARVTSVSRRRTGVTTDSGWAAGLPVNGSTDEAASFLMSALVGLNHYRVGPGARDNARERTSSGLWFGAR